MMLSDSERASRKLRALQVYSDEDGGEYYEAGKNGVTSIEWGWTNGDNAALQTILVFKDGQPHSEHRFGNVLGVYYADDAA